MDYDDDDMKVRFTVADCAAIVCTCMLFSWQLMVWLRTWLSNKLASVAFEV